MSKPELPKDRFLPRLSLGFFSKPKLTALIWLVLVVFGALSYTTLLKREGFPAINIPIAIVSGTYFTDNAGTVDSRIVKPISDLASRQPGVSSVQSSASANFYTVTIQYDESVDARASVKQLERSIKDSVDLPAQASVQYNVPYFGVTGGDSKKVDDFLSIYSTRDDVTTRQLTDKATAAVAYLNAHKPELVKEFFVQDPFKTATDTSGIQVSRQDSFDRYGVRTGNSNTFYDSVGIGVTGVDNVDVIKLDKQLKPLLASLQRESGFDEYRVAIAASNAPAIQDEISELQRVLLEGLIAVLVIGSIVIAVRASLITVIAMITVILSTIGLLYLVGYSLNVITLFALILGLSLIVDDTIIMVEAIEASRRKAKTAKEAVRTATRKIARAMVAATLTATLSFAPLLFVGGVLGSFIRAIPVTIISALLISLLVALIFIPLFARGLLLRPKQLNTKGAHEAAARFEARIARAICRPMLWARGSTRRLVSVGLGAVLLSLAFVVAAGVIFGKVSFNIFPPTKDTNQISVRLSFPDGTTIEQAEAIATQADRLTARTLGSNFEDASYYGMADTSGATSYINIKSYEKRDVTSPQLVAQLQTVFDRDFKAARASVAQIDVGPPAAAFTVQVQTEDRTRGYELAQAIRGYMQTAELKRTDGTIARFKTPTVANPADYVRTDGKQTIDVTAGFDGDDTTTLVTLGQDALKKQFPASKLANYGLSKDALQFNIGQESENQDSFKSLAVAFPLVLLAIYVLLVIEFRSLLQPLFIFMAIPFSLFGVTLGLYLTDNPFSFFAALGFFALIGLSLKNTILLTDYANQARRSGAGAVDAAVEALGERFRPLIATSLTAVVSLIPLAITSPFWQGLAVVLIFGLLSSTLLVILVFPYYYLGGEFLRTHISRKAFFAWAIPTVIATVFLGSLSSTLVLPALVVSLIAAIVASRARSRRA